MKYIIFAVLLAWASHALAADDEAARLVAEITERQQRLVEVLKDKATSEPKESLSLALALAEKMQNSPRDNVLAFAGSTILQNPALIRTMAPGDLSRISDIIRPRVTGEDAFVGAIFNSAFVSSPADSVTFPAGLYFQIRSPSGSQNKDWMDLAVGRTNDRLAVSLFIEQQRKK